MLTRLHVAWGVEAPKKRPRRRPRSLRPRPPADPQLSFIDVVCHGGRRKGAGRPEGPRPNVRHHARPEHDPLFPSLVTLRGARNLPSFRHEIIRKLIEKAIRDTCAQRSEDGFRIVHYSIQGNHLHLLVEAIDKRRLVRGIQSFNVRVAMRFNREVFERKTGRVWGDRYHRRDLESPSEVRQALVYVLKNHTRHGWTAVGPLDPLSSGPWFQGWHHHPPVPPEPCPAALPETFLLHEGWQLASIGFIHIDEVPEPLRRKQMPRR